MNNCLMLFADIISIYSGNHTKHVNTLCGQNAVLLNVKVSGTYSYHCGNHMYHLLQHSRKGNHNIIVMSIHIA
jgi:hypothetical protein